jgi:hypothetical protein
MVAQLERLKKDYRDLENYEFKMNKQGRTDVVRKLKLKRDFLGTAITDLEEQLAA